MGGGDLNLKKSWHPSTFANLEKVWKAEQKDESERKKIEQLQQELKEERAREELQRAAEEAGAVKKKENRVDWLYSGPAAAVNREEYLLGKKIDKLIDPTLQETEREKEAVETGGGALFADNASSGANSAADMAMKIREDPLFLIKQKELEAKKRLASNPIKLKRLQQLVTEEKGKASHGHKKKKHKRDRARDSESPPPSKRRRSPSPSSSEDRRSYRSFPVRRDRQDPSQRPAHSKSSTVRGRHQPYSKPHSRTSKMDPEELERRRQEMMSNGKEHDKQRGRRLRLHEELERKEKEVKNSGDFLQPLRVQSLSTSASLKDRIHRNINAVQRTSAQLDSHFMSK